MKIICIFSGTTLLDDVNRYGFGKDNNLLVKSKSDLQKFKKLTTGYPLIMGRKTYESIGSKDLPKRESLIISKTMKGKNIFNNIKDAIDYAKEINSEKLFIIGGATIIQEAMKKYATDVYITIFNAKVTSDEVDTFLDYKDLWPDNSLVSYSQINESCTVINKEQKCDIYFFEHTLGIIK